MARRIVVVVIALFAIALSAGPAAAQGEEHNCAGTVSSGLAQALNGAFGGVVAAAAHQQAVDDFGLANCGDTGETP